ncbi:MAG: efflux RND transporter periplasmic adaptor subunit [Lentimicrobium sp.]|nr:efflux RND transporter periplasmic adaptor subunit [Lentimicrobium sp.]
MKNITLFFCLSALIWSCTSSKNPKTDDEHLHEAKLQLTAYSGLFEVFAEADPFVVGKKSAILAHFTWIEDFKPLENGAVTVSLITGAKGVRQTLNEPTRKGIYSFLLQPETEGRSKLIFSVTTQRGEEQIVVSDIMVFTDEHDAEHDAAAREIASSTAVVFTKEQSWKVNFATAFPAVEPFGEVIKTTAQVQSSQGDEMIVSAKTSGIVAFTGGSILEGNNVLSGQKLLTIYGNEFADNNSSVRFAEAKNNFENAKANYERSVELAKDKIVSEKDLHKAKNHYDNSKAIFENLNKNFNPTGQMVICPLSGFVKQMFVQNGQYIEAGQPLMIISQNKTLVLIAEVQQKYIPVLGAIKTANIRTVHDNQTYTFEELNGKILSYGRSASSDNYLIPVNLSIDNKGCIVPGGFVEIYLKTMTNVRAITVPNEALLEEQGNYFVFVQITPELFDKREVRPGATDGLRTEILNGLSSTERIVTIGAILIKLAQSTGTLDAHSGHVH